MESPISLPEPKPQLHIVEKLKRKVELTLFERQARRRIRKFIREANAINENNYSRHVHLGTDLYLRKSKRSYNGKLYTMFDVAKVSFPEKDWRKGKFSRLMEIVDELNPWDGVRIESITNPVLVGWAERRMDKGWQLEPNTDSVHPNYYRLKTPTPQQS